MEIKNLMFIYIEFQEKIVKINNISKYSHEPIWIFVLKQFQADLIPLLLQNYPSLIVTKIWLYVLVICFFATFAPVTDCKIKIYWHICRYIFPPVEKSTFLETFSTLVKDFMFPIWQRSNKSTQFINWFWHYNFYDLFATDPKRCPTTATVCHVFTVIYCQGFAEVEELLKKEGICLATTDKLIKDSGVAAASAYDKIVYNLRKTNARGVIVFGSDQEVGELMRATERNNMTGYFTWIGSDGWGGRALVSNGNEAQVKMITDISYCKSNLTSDGSFPRKPFVTLYPIRFQTLGEWCYFSSRRLLQK